MKRKLVLLATGLGLMLKMSSQTVNWGNTNNYNSLYTGQQGAVLYTGGFQSANAPEGGSRANYFNVWHQNFLEPQAASSLAISSDNNLYSRIYTYGTWSTWNKYWHSGNLNRRDVGLNCSRLYIDSNNDNQKDHIIIQGNGNLGITFKNWVEASRGFIWWNDALGAFAIGAGDESNSLFFKNNNVLIGKTTQNEGANYKLDVAGSIRANAVVCNTTGADFVFEPTYQLRPLSEVETFIKTHKHLPEIAPAADMQTNGVNVNELETKLLQKVEELTLYVIEQQKQIEALKKENEQMKKGSKNKS